MLGTVLGLGGLRVSGPSKGDVRNKYLKEHPDEYLNVRSDESARTYQELTTPQKRELDKKLVDLQKLSPDRLKKEKVAADFQESRNKLRGEIEAMEPELEKFWRGEASKVTIDQYNKAVKAYRVALAVLSETERTNRAYRESLTKIKGVPGSTALEGYYKIFDEASKGIITDPDDEVFELADAYIGGLNEADQKFVLASLGVNDTPLMKVRRAAMKTLSPYFNIKRDELKKPQYLNLDTKPQAERKRLESQLASSVRTKQESWRNRSSKEVKALGEKWLGWKTGTTGRGRF